MDLKVLQHPLNCGIAMEGITFLISCSAPILNEAATATKKSEVAPTKTKVKSPSPQKTLPRTPSGGTINHLAEEEDGAAPASSEEQQGDSHLPEGFFDDPVVDARARGKEYKVVHIFIYHIYRTFD